MPPSKSRTRAAGGRASSSSADAVHLPGIFRPGSTIDGLNAMSIGTAMEPLGILFTELGPDFLRATMPVDARTRQPYGLLHGGASVLLAETLGSSAGMLCVGEDEGCVGIEINANHLRAVSKGTLRVEAKSIYHGRTLSVWQVEITNERGKLICVSRCTLSLKKGAAFPAKNS